VGCNQPSPKTTLGNLPGPPSGDSEPKVNAATYFACGHLLERHGDFERAAIQYWKAITLQPDFLTARNRLGITLNKLGRHTEASAQFRQAIADHPASAYLHNNLGFSLYLEGQYAAAQEALDQALKLRPDFPRAHMNRALVLARQKCFDEAFSELKLAGDQANACFNMGIILTEAGLYADATHYLEAALAVKPDFDAAEQQLREVSRLAAEQDARQAAQATPPTDTTAESTALEPTDTAAVEPTTEEVTPELTETVFADATGAEGEIPADPNETFFADAAGAEEDTTNEFIPDPNDTLFVDGAGMEEEATAETDFSPSDAVVGPELPQVTQEPYIDLDVLFAMIDEAIWATQNQTEDAESLWCQVGYYLFPETAPDGWSLGADWSSVDEEVPLEIAPEPVIGK
jgi:tetratricopeptide (TPR) repeat protein